VHYSQALPSDVNAPLVNSKKNAEHLNLQIDLLAEREMTTVLQLLQDIAASQRQGLGHA
jgi:hypothetical protein